jgi:branched-chain amino acid transport system permease protein
MVELAQHLLDALSVGATYALLALGLTLLFGVMGLVNFAYGMLIVSCGYAISLLDGWHVPLVASVVAVVAFSTSLSVAMGQVAFRPFRSAPPLTLLLTSFGVALILQAIVRMTFGEGFRRVPTPALLGEGWHVAGVRVSVLQAVAVGAGTVVVAALYLVLQRTNLGLQMRAYAEDAELARIMGVRTDQVLATAFVISGVIAGIVSMVWFARIGTVQPSGDLTPTLKAFIAIVIGGLGSVRGAVLGGLLLGAFESFLVAYLPPSLLPYGEAMAFGLVILVLLLRPGGIAGRTVEVSK